MSVARSLVAAAAITLLTAGVYFVPASAHRRAPGSERSVNNALTTLAFRVNRMPQMLAFYSEAFGVRFREVDTGGGIRSRFGELNGVTLKFVPIREDTDFEGFAVHQPGFDVADVAGVVAAARRHGGVVLHEPVVRDGRLHAAIRDPDGNTLELYGPMTERR